MNPRFLEYLKRQKAFWETSDEETARFKRVFTGERTEEEWAASAQRDTTQVLQGVSLPEDSAVLELGCGVGRILEQVRRRVPSRRLVGVDISESMLRFARRRLGKDPRIGLVLTNGCSLSSISDTSINLAYSVDVLIHIHDAQMLLEYLREVRRVLKSGGMFRFNLRRFNPEGFSNSLGGRGARWMCLLGLGSSAGHRWHPREEVEFNGNEFTEAEARRLLRRAGFSILSVWTVLPYYWCAVRKA